MVAGVGLALAVDVVDLRVPEVVDALHDAVLGHELAVDGAQLDKGRELGGGDVDVGAQLGAEPLHLAPAEGPRADDGRGGDGLLRREPEPPQLDGEPRLRQRPRALTGRAEAGADDAVEGALDEVVVHPPRGVGSQSP